MLKDCDEEFKTFLTTMETLGEKLGPLLFQFGKFDKYEFKSLDDFLARLIPFLKKLPKEHKFAMEHPTARTRIAVALSFQNV